MTGTALRLDTSTYIAEGGTENEGIVDEEPSKVQPKQATDSELVLEDLSAGPSRLTVSQPDCGALTLVLTESVLLTVAADLRSQSCWDSCP